VLTRKLGKIIIKTCQENLALQMGGFMMKKEEILAKSRADNKNRDIYEQEVLKNGWKISLTITGVLALIFFAMQIYVGGGANYGLWAIMFSGEMTTSWIKWIKLKKKGGLVTALMNTVVVLGFSAMHFYSLLHSSTMMQG